MAIVARVEAVEQATRSDAERGGLTAVHRWLQRGQVLRRALLTGGAVAGPLFVGTATAQGAVRRNYDPQRHPVSSLALGPGGRLQAANFVVTGSLYCGLVLGLARVQPPVGLTRSGRVLLGAAALGLVGAGLFPTDPVSGYPAGTADTPAERTRAGALHDAVSIPTFLAIPAAALIQARAVSIAGQPGWAAASAGSGLLMLGSFAAATVGFSQHPALVNRAGLMQRVSVTAGFGWLSAVALRALRAAPPE
jgi:hypothetical protein